MEFKIASISTIDEASEFLKNYIPEFNKLFSVEPKGAGSAFRPLPDELDLDCIFCIKQKRKVDRSGVFSFYGKQFKIEPKENQPSIPPKATINVFISSISGVRVKYKGVVYETELFIKPKKVADSAPKKRKSITSYV
ncbi:hypothetical protein [Caldanaerobius polysaccharolyticus]|uniref:hypothetical protein n=1 Tax=Caldanaerobius polysaccharolyticus TaxID=44256 RepID=UPI00047E4999|nr:hypothetical protein [Caldanaerobius polysaccharolyticus]